MIVDKIIENKDRVQNFLDNLNCDADKWFVFNCATGDNPTLRKFSHKMSYRIMNNNTCLLYTSPSPRDLSTSRMPSSA